ncbi:MAG: hypothetical protein KIT58_06830 [Planctomycetota bacterium]|nr:hypothetical protein [Planctomycetota bacterium]
MSDPDVRVTVKGLAAAQRRLALLLRLRRQAERKGLDLERVLRELERQLTHLDRESRRA